MADRMQVTSFIGPTEKLDGLDRTSSARPWRADRNLSPSWVVKQLSRYVFFPHMEPCSAACGSPGSMADRMQVTSFIGPTEKARWTRQNLLGPTLARDP